MHPFTLEGASMPVRNVSPPPQRSLSALDHRAIDMAGHLLVVGIWLERQLSVPKILKTLAAESGTSGRLAKVSRFSPFFKEER
jgi:hypothetical protein